MRQTVDSQLTYAVRRKLEEAVVAATVTGAGSTQSKGADALPVATLKLLTTMRNLDVDPNAILLNPVDYEALRTLSGRSPYLSGPPITVDSDGTERLFAVPLIVTPSVADDTAVVADMQSVTVWLRDLQVYLSESHASYFVNNLVAILAELRAALAVTVTAGVGTVTGWTEMGVFSMEALEALRPHREVVQVLEHQPARQLVAAHDIVRVDKLGRRVCACPAGQAPAGWLHLTQAERAALVEPPPPPHGHKHPRPYGFTPEGVVTGGWTFVTED